jgi:ABC-type nickel/cobalt efflux system permease component RcnA
MCGKPHNHSLTSNQRRSNTWQLKRFFCVGLLNCPLSIRIGKRGSLPMSGPMYRLIAVTVTCVTAGALAVCTAVGIVAVRNATPEQPNVPLVSFPGP